MSATYSKPVCTDGRVEPLISIQKPDPSLSLTEILKAIEADPQGIADIKRFAPAFMLWESGFRLNPSAVLNDAEVLALDSSDLATQRAAYFVLCVRKADACDMVAA